MMVDIDLLEEKIRDLLPGLYSNEYGRGYCDGICMAVGVIAYVREQQIAKEKELKKSETCALHGIRRD